MYALVNNDLYGPDSLESLMENPNITALYIAPLNAFDGLDASSFATSVSLYFNKALLIMSSDEEYIFLICRNIQNILRFSFLNIS
jgi:hypothetical protein